jgi:hypothetical protein
MIVSDLDGTMVGDDAATAAFKDWWEDEGVLRGGLLVYNTGRWAGSANWGEIYKGVSACLNDSCWCCSSSNKKVAVSQDQQQEQQQQQRRRQQQRQQQDQQQLLEVLVAHGTWCTATLHHTAAGCLHTLCVVAYYSLLVDCFMPDRLIVIEIDDLAGWTLQLTAASAANRVKSKVGS